MFYDPFKGKGKILYQSYDSCVWIAPVDGAPGYYMTCTQQRVDPILEHNKAELNDNAGKRWGEGRIAARVPLDVYFDKIVPAKKAGDQKYIKKMLNDSDYRDFRTFPGRL
jgi:hypothetical protein